MAMGKKRKRNRQTSLWVATADLPQSAGHPFYERLNRVLDEAGFDAFVEGQCATFYCAAGTLLTGWRSYWTMIMLGRRYEYGQGVSHHRARASRARGTTKMTPDHNS